MTDSIEQILRDHFYTGEPGQHEAIRQAAITLRASSAQALPPEPRRIEVDIGAAAEALQNSPELCAMMNEMVGGPALVEAQAEIERLNGIIAALPASSGEVREELRRLVDVVWNHATESTAVPSTKTADTLIDRAALKSPSSSGRPNQREGT